MTAFGVHDCACFDFADQAFPDALATIDAPARKPVFLPAGAVREAFTLWGAAIAETWRSLDPRGEQRGRRYFAIHLGPLHVMGFRS